MSRKMYIYRADFQTENKPTVKFFYARNAKVGKAFCRTTFNANPATIQLNKIGKMTLDVGNPDAAAMDETEEMRLILQNYGAGVKYSERDDIDGYFEPAADGDMIDRDTEQL